MKGRNILKLYSVNNIITGALIYGMGDTIASLVLVQFNLHELSLLRCLGMSLIGALLYSIEIPHIFFG